MSARRNAIDEEMERFTRGRMKEVLAHMRVLWGLRKPSGLAAYAAGQREQGTRFGMEIGQNRLLSEIALMPRNERRKLVFGAVKTFGRKPRRVVDGFRPGVKEDDQDALAYLREQTRSMGWPEWKEGSENG